MSLKPNILKEQFQQSIEQTLPRDLGDGLVLRYASADDAEPLAQFNGWIHGQGRFDAMVAAWTRDLCSDAHPTCGPSNITVVQDTRSGKIVSSICLIPQTWTYEGIPFDVGMLEAVGTAREYRRHGLVRSQFEVLHAKSAAMGHMVQSISGIAWFYRQFGYEYALELEAGKTILFASIPTLKTGDSAAYRLRPLRADDLPLAIRLFHRGSTRSMVTCPRPDWLWEYMLAGASPDSMARHPFQIIEAADGRAVGYLAPSQDVDHNLFAVQELEVVEGLSLRAVMPSVLRALKPMADALALKQHVDIQTIFFHLGSEHPLYDAIPELLMRTRRPYAWYIRVADVCAFIRHIAPALEARLASSPIAGHTGELHINMYTDGLRIAFNRGRIEQVEPWQTSSIEEERDSGFPPLVFLQLLFGYRSLSELRVAFPDCWATDEATVLLNSLFPRKPSHVIPVS